MSTRTVPDTKPNKDDRIPPRAAKMAPVMAPLPMEFQGSSLSRTAMRAQSKDEYIPPHTAKFPAREVEIERGGKGGGKREGKGMKGEGEEERRERREGKGYIIIWKGVNIFINSKYVQVSQATLYPMSECTYLQEQELLL